MHKLASVLFEAEQEALRSGAATLEDAEVATDTFIREARQDLPAGSKTAAAIDRGAAWEEISELAEEEGLHQIASVLFEAEQRALAQPFLTLFEPPVSTGGCRLRSICPSLSERSSTACISCRRCCRTGFRYVASPSSISRYSRY